MSLFPRAKIRWNEPDAFRRAASRSWLVACATLPWKRLSVYSLAGTVGLAIIVWYNNHFIQVERPMPIPCYFGGFICFFWAFSLPLLWIEKRFFKTIWLYPHRVTKFGGQNCRYLKTLSGFFWVEEKEYFVLHLVRKRGFAAHYGVPDTVTRDQIETLLFEAGLVKTLLETVHP